ncbi:hypothetical protein [Candidatus Desulforudis audaxviator]|uniref:Uncharacterized protein n=1 Tax=Desulforudis audaxviator (strain MP104C) TaxID=477974 RepID=B1I240_DESAP|nr:hypothetical protein [Candidatus Desulforudis audaxviator]ACA59089.1 hypothetical protein Daud_0548 [Candidatus Desulforudis audaxviator MP104C]AZK59142.1 hypothetical protein Daudx_0587 [Candidatus Desulforudis audaxviator]
MAAKKKEKRKKQNDKKAPVGTNRPVGADIAPGYVAEDLTGYRVPFNDKK